MTGGFIDTRIEALRSWYRRSYIGRYRALTASDARQNRRFNAPQRFLVVRHPTEDPYFYDVILDWLDVYYPEIRALFELRLLPCRVTDWSPYVLHIPWLQDPVQRWSPRAYGQAVRLAEECDEREIPIINRVDRLINCTKSTGASLISGTGIRTARMARITDAADFYESACGIPLPLFVREDWGHGGLVMRADTMEEVRKISLHHFVRPVAVEYIETSTESDGLYRKYRYVVAGDEGVSQTMHIARGWKAKGVDAVFTPALRQEEIDFINRPNPFHADFLKAKAALGVDYVAYDYTVDRQGRLLIWEANPYPTLHFPFGRWEYRSFSTAKVIAALAKLYLTKAKMPIPGGIEETLRATNADIRFS